MNLAQITVNIDVSLISLNHYQKRLEQYGLYEFDQEIEKHMLILLNGIDNSTNRAKQSMKIKTFMDKEGLIYEMAELEVGGL